MDKAQENTYPNARQEIRNGRKASQCETLKKAVVEYEINNKLITIKMDPFSSNLKKMS